jgi:hypothetical protein
VQQAAAKLVIETSYAEAQALFHDLTGVHLGSERMHTLTNRAAQGLSANLAIGSFTPVAR